MATTKHEYTHTFDTKTSDAPPSYDVATRFSQQPQSAVIPRSLGIKSPVYPQNDSFRPIVVPQTSKSFRGAFFSPFSRAWAPSLSQHDITQSQFLNFIDKLNEAFIAAPAFQVASLIGGVMGFMPHPINFAGIGLQAGAGLASAGTSWARAKALVKEANATMFEPRGLKVKVLKTKKMMLAVGAKQDYLRLPPLVEMDAESVSKAEWDSMENDPRMRRMRALGERVAELRFDGLPEPEEMSNWWKKMGSRQAQKRDEKTIRKLMKEREKVWEEMEKGSVREYKKAAKYDKEIREIEEDRAKEIQKAQKQLSGRKGADPKERAKIEGDLQGEMRKIDHDLEKVLRKREKKVGDLDVGNVGVIGHRSYKAQEELAKTDRKENKIAQKIYWVVIDKIERLEEQVPTKDDVESLESP